MSQRHSTTSLNRHNLNREDLNRGGPYSSYLLHRNCNPIPVTLVLGNNSNCLTEGRLRDLNRLLRQLLSSDFSISYCILQLHSFCNHYSLIYKLLNFLCSHIAKIFYFSNSTPFFQRLMDKILVSNRLIRILIIF